MINTLEFQLKNQILSGGSPVVSDSRNMICAHFLLDVEPKGSVTAIFCGPTKIPYCKLLGEDYVCEVPWEAMVLPNKNIASYFSVSLVIGERLTTSCAIVPLIPSGYTDCETPQPPTPSVYEELLTAYRNITDKLNSIPDTDQKYSPESDNPQSGKAVAEAIGNIQVDQHYDSQSENAQSGKAVDEALIYLKNYIPEVDQTYDSASENPQSGTAVGHAISDAINNIRVDQSFDKESPYPQSGIAVAEALSIVENKIPTVDQTYNHESENPQSGIAVAEAINAIHHPQRVIKLANDITITEEDTSMLCISICDDGTAYDFDFVEVIFVPVTSNMTNVVLEVGLSSSEIKYDHMTQDSYTFAIGKIQNASPIADNAFMFYSDKNLFWSGYAMRRGGGTGSPYNYGYFMPIVRNKGDVSITNLDKNTKKVWINSNVAFPVGSNFKIFGGKYQ